MKVERGDVSTKTIIVTQIANNATTGHEDVFFVGIRMEDGRNSGCSNAWISNLRVLYCTRQNTVHRDIFKVLLITAATPSRVERRKSSLG